MSQVHVERVIGHLATDEATRRRFSADPGGVLADLIARGMELNPCELRSLADIDPQELARFAEAIDPRLQRADLHGGDP
jgi:hypothetical protein